MIGTHKACNRGQDVHVCPGSGRQAQITRFYIKRSVCGGHKGRYAELADRQLKEQMDHGGIPHDAEIRHLGPADTGLIDQPAQQVV